MAKLIFHLEESESIEVLLDKRVSFGSSEGNDVQIDGEGIDTFHAVVFRDESGAYWIKHLATSHSTLVNGHHTLLSKLRDQDQISLGFLRGVFHETTQEEREKRITPEEQKSQLEDELKALEVSKSALEDEIQSLQQQKKALESSIQKNQTELDDLTHLKDKASIEKANYQKVIVELEEEVAKRRIDLQRLQMEQKEIEAQKGEADRELHTLRQSVEEIGAQVAKLLDKEKQTNEKLKAFDAEMSSLSLKKKDLEKDLNDLQALREKESQIHHRLQEVGLQLKEHEDQLDQLKQLKRQQELQQEKIGEEIAKLETVRNELTSECDAWNEKLKAMEFGLEQQRVETKFLEERLNEGAQWLARHDNVAHTLHEEIELLYQRKAKLQEECQAEESRLDRWKQEVAALQDRHARLLQQVQQAQDRTLHLSEIQAFLAKGEELWRQKEELMEKQFLEDQKVLEDLKKEIQETKQKLLSQSVDS